MPHIPDKKYAFIVARTYYEELMEAGVKIYEYTPGFVHAKVFVSDDEKAVVGTINLDYRSLYHHFECGVFLYRNSQIGQIEQDTPPCSISLQSRFFPCEKFHEIPLKDLSYRHLFPF